MLLRRITSKLGSVSSRMPRNQQSFVQKRRIGSYTWNTKVREGQVVSPGHQTFKFNASEMERGRKMFPDHQLFQGDGYLGFGAGGRSKARQSVSVQIGDETYKVGALMKDLVSDASRDMGKYGPPDKVVSLGNLSNQHIAKLVERHDAIQQSGFKYRTDIHQGFGFEASGLESTRTLNCVGANSLLGEEFGAPVVTKRNTTPQERAHQLDSFRLLE